MNKDKKIKNLRAKAKISTKYQIVIPKNIRDVVDNVKPGNEVYVSVKDSDSIEIKTKKTSWVNKYSGELPKGYYGEDSTEYVSNLRDEWDE